MRQACKLACIDDFIMSLPEGYATVVGEGGHRFYADDAWGVLHSLWQPSRD